MPLAIFSTWTTYGTWLRGDKRGWYEPKRGVQLADSLEEWKSLIRSAESSFTLNREQRTLVEATIVRHCEIRRWTLHAVNCRTNHVHVLVTAAGRDIEIPREQFKAWCTRKLMELERSLGVELVRGTWWTDRGWDEAIDDDVGVANVGAYIRDGQDGDRFEQ